MSNNSTLIPIWVFVFVSSLFIPFLLYGQNTNRMQIAVMSLEEGSKSGSDILVILNNRLRSELVNTGRFDVMERSRMDEILKEHGFQQTGLCDDNECIIKVGNMLGVNRMVISDFGKIGNMYSVSARIVDIESGKILLSRSEDCECPIEDVLTKSMRNLAFKLAGLNQEHPIATPGSVTAKLSVSGTPTGATITLGNRIIGDMPLKDLIVSWGQYNLGIKHSGYENAKYIVKLAPAETKMLRINLIPKKKLKAVFRSVIFPGFGQKYAEKSGRAILYPILELAAIGGIIWADDKVGTEVKRYKGYKHNYTYAITEDEIDLSRNGMDKAYKSAVSARDQRTLMIGAAAGIWIWNVLDAAIWGPNVNTRKQIGHHSVTPKFYCCDESGNAQLKVSFQF